MHENYSTLNQELEAVQIRGSSLQLVSQCAFCGLVLTPSQQQKEPPFLAELAEDHHQHEEEHDPLTEHPGEDSSEEIVEQGSHKGTAYPVAHGSVHSSQEHHVAQQEGNGQVQVDQIVHFREHLLPKK